MNRRGFLKGTAFGLTSLAIPVGSADASIWEAFFQKHFLEMNEDEKKKVIKRMEKEYAKKLDTKFNIKTTKAEPGVLFGYGLDLSRCIGCRRCVYACVRENNQSRDPQIHWISVLQFDSSAIRKGGEMGQ
jgi:molybdopterin-containing oxidoreductase family iron-sulfur binding subunit